MFQEGLSRQRVAKMEGEGVVDMVGFHFFVPQPTPSVAEVGRNDKSDCTHAPQGRYQSWCFHHQR